MALSLGKRIVFGLTITLVTLAALEGIARLLPKSISGRREVVQNPDPGSQIMVSSEEVPGWDLNYPKGNVGPFSYTSNHWRMRGPEYPDEKASGVVRVILVGDSSIFGYLLDWEDTMSAHLERLRETRFPGTDYQVANCAVPGHSSLQSIYKLERQCMDFQPDVVIIGNLNSDGTKYYATDRERFHTPAFDGPVMTLQKFALYRTMRNVWLAQQIKKDAAKLAEEIPQLNSPDAPKGTIPRTPIDEYRENLSRLAAIARAGGAKPVFLVLPSQFDLNPNGASSRNDYVEAMRAVAKAEGAPVADGPERFQQLPQMDELFIDPVHPGKLGARILGVMLDEALGPEKP